MRRISRSALVSYSPEQMFAIVNDVTSYEDFLPYCERSEVLEECENEMLARLTLAKGPIRKSFTTRNRLERPRKIAIELEDGPFDRLTGEWSFTGLDGAGTKVAMELELAFGSGVLEKAAGMLLAETADGLVETFCRRADAAYGSGAE